MTTDGGTECYKLHDVQAEKALLASVFVKPETIYEVREQISPDDFYRSSHAVVYRAMLNIALQKTGIDIITVENELRRMGKLDSVGISLVLEIAGLECTASFWRKYAGIVQDYSRRRELVQVAEEIKAKAVDVSEDIDVTGLQERMSKIHLGKTDDGIADANTAALEFSAWLEKESDAPSGLVTGFSELDRFVCGFRPGDLVILAARPSMGKTAFAINLLINMSKSGKRPLFYSMEMTREQIMSRIVANVAGIDSKILLQPSGMRGGDWDKAMQAFTVISTWPFLLTDKRGLSVSDVSSIARRTVAKHGLDAIIIDHLQLMRSGRKREENRAIELDYISWGLKNLAGELGVPVIVLSQLSRAVESRNDKHPMLSDLRDSGAIEQNADIVLMMYRDRYYNESGDNTAEVSVKKNRNGGCGCATFRFYPELCTFEQIDFGGQCVEEVPG